jgi:hypothetical protein
MSKVVVLAFFLTSGLCTAQTTAPMPDGPGKAVIQKACAGCHSLKVVTSKRATHDEWAALVDQMISKGAEVSDDDLEVVVQYLATHYGPVKDPNATPDKPSITSAVFPEPQKLHRLLGLSNSDFKAEEQVTASK